MITSEAKLAGIGLLAGVGQLIIRDKLQPVIWERLTVQCLRASGQRCTLICPGPCCQAKRCIEHLMPVFFVDYARWN